MRRLIVAGNWKMNGSKPAIATWLQEFKKNVTALSHIEWIVLPPYVYLDQFATNLSSVSQVKLGAQNLSAYEASAYTGEISATMLQEFECKCVLVGHSERRTLMNESNELVAKKFFQAKKNKLTPILCVGETLEQRQKGLTKQIIIEQLDAVLNANSGIEAFADSMVAYEPVWAIGTGEAASPQQAQDVHQAIRQYLNGLNQDIASCLPILYGGSVKASNAAALFEMPDIDGGLIGGASLDAKEFLEIGRCIKSY